MGKVGQFQCFLGAVLFFFDKTTPFCITTARGPTSSVSKYNGLVRYEFGPIFEFGPAISPAKNGRKFGFYAKFRFDMVSLVKSDIFMVREESGLIDSNLLLFGAGVVWIANSFDVPSIKRLLYVS